MAEWDPKKHKVILTKTVKTEKESTKIVVELYSYDGGPESIGLRMQIIKKDGNTLTVPLKGGIKTEIAKKVFKAGLKMLREFEGEVE